MSNKAPKIYIYSEIRWKNYAIIKEFDFNSFKKEYF